MGSGAYVKGLAVLGEAERTADDLRAGDRGNLDADAARSLLRACALRGAGASQAPLDEVTRVDGAA